MRSKKCQRIFPEDIDRHHITITTRQCDSDRVEIAIADRGLGMECGGPKTHFQSIFHYQTHWQRNGTGDVG